jgi:hypothetical protein
MKKQRTLLTLVYGYISFAFAAIFVDALGIFHPIPDILAGIWLLTACFYIGKYGNLPKPK